MRIGIASVRAFIIEELMLRKGTRDTALTFLETSGIEQCESLTARSAGSEWSLRCRVSAWLENHCASKEAGHYIFSMRDRAPGAGRPRCGAREPLDRNFGEE